MFQWGMRQWSELVNQMTSVERIQQYVDLEPEKDDQAKEVPKTWPQEGNIEFKNVFLRYSDDASPVLNNLNFIVKSKEKVGIVGRTGAGKSSLIQALFRLASTEGKIIIDDLDTKTVSLNKLRSQISIIPQEPVLFSGTLRKNLDPFDEYKDLVSRILFTLKLFLFLLLHLGFMECIGRSRTEGSRYGSSSRLGK